LLNGLGLRFILEFDKKPFKVHDLTLIRRVHLTLGIITWIIARVIVFTGTIMFKSTFGPLFLILVIIETVLFLLIIIGMTVLKKLKKKSWVEKVKEDFKAKQEAADHHQEMLRDIRSRMSVEQLSAKYPKRNVMLYLNKVIDMDSYIHPGGQFLFEECRWKEISRYITGAAGLERFNGMRWIHSHTTFDLMKKHAIGDLVDTVPTYDSLVLRDTNKAQVLSNFSEIWKVSKSVQISPTTSIVFMHNTKFIFSLWNKGVEWMGKHFLVSNEIKSRPYTVCVSLAPVYSAYIENLLSVLDLVLNGKLINIRPQLPEFFEMVPLCIKAYEGKRPLSKEITQAAPDYGYQLEGPMGRGLEIPPGFTGEVVIIAAGTGILPFADILDLLLKKTIFSLLKARN
jgi:hypothetical protein